MGNCNGDCASCGNCASCGGCAGTLSLTRPEVDVLLELGQVAFLPVARSMGQMDPVCLELPGEQAQNTNVLLCLEKKGLISLDYDRPLKGFAGDAYALWPIRGSMALTQRGQRVLELMEYQGVSE